MKKKIICILILLRHGINPWGRLATSVVTMKQKLTDEEKEFLVNCAESKIDKELWRKWLY